MFLGSFFEHPSIVISLLSRYSGQNQFSGLSLLNNITSNHLLSLVTFWVISYLSVYFYIDSSHNWVRLGSGLTLFNPLIFFIEIPFAVFFATFFFFPSVKNPWLRYVFPLVPIIVLYGLVDGFFNFMGRSPHFSDFQNFNTIFEFSFVLVLNIFLFAALIPLSIWALINSARKHCSRKQICVSVSIRAALMVLLLFVLSSESLNQIHEQQFNYTVWSEEDTLRENGKFSSFVFYSNQERINQKKLVEIDANNTALDIHRQLYSGFVKKPQNIHFIVLESFIDPRLIEQLDFEKQVLANELLPYLNNTQDFSHVVSPIYGGGTAQAEFELLTGLKALSKVNQIEFNVMKGGAISSFVSRLEQNQYHAIATIAPSSSFFNSRLAYKSLGFTNIEFLEDDRELNGLPDNGPLFDGDLLQQNLIKIKNTLAEGDAPIFNYVLGMYGHLPFRRNESKRPDVVNVEHEDDRMRRISNQFYYRTKALAKYLQQLIALDENAIIYITSDHLPSILGPNLSYKLNNKINIALLVNRGKNVDVSGKSLYQIPWLIWDLLSESTQYRNIQDAKMEQLYYKALSQSLNL